MRPITMMASCLLLAAPLASRAQADNGNNLVGQAQKFFDSRGDDRGAYERGRDDEMRRHQAERDGYRHRDDDRAWNGDDRNRELTQDNDNRNYR